VFRALLLKTAREFADIMECGEEGKDGIKFFSCSSPSLINQDLGRRSDIKTMKQGGMKSWTMARKWTCFAPE